MNITKSKVALGLKLLLGLVLCIVIYFQIKDKLTPETIAALADTVSEQSIWWLILALLFMPLNWGIEGEKWRLANTYVERISSFNSFKSIFSGICLGILTPARIGEIGGRIIYFQAQNRSKAIGNWFLTGLSQMIPTVFFGIAGLTLLVEQSQLGIALSNIVVIGALIVGLVMGLLYHRVILTWIVDRPFFEKVPFVLEMANQVIKVPSKLLLSLIGLGFTRYLVYTSQYILLSFWLGMSVEIYLLFACIASVFVIRILFPLPPMLNLLASGELAILIWGIVGVSEFTSILMILIISTINLVIPALIGWFIIWREDFSELLIPMQKLKSYFN